MLSLETVWFFIQNVYLIGLVLVEEDEVKTGIYLSSPTPPNRTGIEKPVLQENKDGSCEKPLPLILRWLSIPGGFTYCTQEQDNSVTLVGQRQAFISPHGGLNSIGKFPRKTASSESITKPKSLLLLSKP